MLFIADVDRICFAK